MLASLDREDEEPYYAWAWKGSNHPSVPGEDTKITVMRFVKFDVINMHFRFWRPFCLVGKYVEINSVCMGIHIKYFHYL